MRFSQVKIKNSFAKSLFLAFIGAFVYWFSDQLNQEPKVEERKITESQKQEISGTSRVVDGDTIVIEKNRIRLDLIDAPESKQKCFDANDEKYDCGVAATRFLSDLIGAKTVSCFYEKKDIYDRFLAICYVDNVNINLQMLSKGLVVIYNYSHVNDEFLQAEEKAKASKLGLWQGAFQRPKDFRKSQKNKK